MTVEKIRECIESKVGRKVKVTTKEGRQHFVERRGIIEQTYPSVFVVSLFGRDADSEKNRVSFSYIDLLTHNVELTVFKPTA